jgi:hypothetical protein
VIAGHGIDLHVENILGSNTGKLGEFDEDRGTSVVVELGGGHTDNVDGDLNLGALPLLGGGKSGLSGGGLDRGSLDLGIVVGSPRIGAEAEVAGTVVGSRAGELGLANHVAVLDSGGIEGNSLAVGEAVSGLALPVLDTRGADILGESTVVGVIFDTEVVGLGVTLVVRGALQAQMKILV